MNLEISLAIVLLALLAEAAAGYPAALLRSIGHPVMWVGWLIERLDRRLNREDRTAEHRRVAGVVAVLIILAAGILSAGLVQLALLAILPDWLAVLLLALLAGTLLAQRSLATHVAAVADALDREGLAGGRRAIAHIVGRNPEHLDEAGVARAAIESLAENFADGVVAPAFWCGVFGLPGIAAYKAINTADSMIGHRTKKHEAFGWAAARLDDLVNLPASRLAALWLVAAAALQPGADAAAAWRTVRRDARHHRSPNAGWPEAAMAGALGLRLNGPRVYGTTRVEDHWMGAGREAATAQDIRRALSLYRLACGIEIAVVAVLVAIIVRG